MHGFHGNGKRRSYFEGWYFKQQNEEDTVAFIPAFHVNASGQASASLQVITNEGSCYVGFPKQAFHASQKQLLLHLGDCVFSSNGCDLNIDEKECTLHGALRFGAFTPPAYDIMGPFRFVPFMQCRHSILSLHHQVDGRLTINGKNIHIQNGSGFQNNSAFLQLIVTSYSGTGAGKLVNPLLPAAFLFIVFIHIPDIKMVVKYLFFTFTSLITLCGILGKISKKSPGDNS